MVDIFIFAANQLKRNFIRYALTVFGVLVVLTLTACGLSSSIPAIPTVEPSSSPIVDVQPTPEDSAIPVFNTHPVNTPNPVFSSAVSEPLESLVPISDLNEEYAEYGSFTIEGMFAEDYNAAMSIHWAKVETFGEPTPYDIDLTKRIDVDMLEQYILNLGRYDGVDVAVIGQSELGRNIYMITVNLGGGSDKPLIMLSGGVHAREFAGPEYLIKCLNDTLAKSQTDAYTRLMLSRVTIVVVPLVNPDGRELIMDGGASRRKSNANGVDLNRAMPSVNAGQLAPGVRLVEDFSNHPGLAFFAGEHLGAESETQALIKWYNTYVPKATAYIDMHQQGGISYYDKAFATSESDEACFGFARAMNGLLGGGYRPKGETEDYALDGDGGTLTDYARSVAEGFVFSDRLGRMALLMDGVETPLICFGDLDDWPEYYTPVNPDFLCMTFEIGRNASYLGPGSGARKKRASEYEKYGWENFLTGMIEILTG